MPDINPLAVIAECIEKAKAITAPELISDYFAEALGVLQIDNTEDDAFHMLGSAIVDAVADDEEHSASVFEVWTELEEQRKLSQSATVGVPRLKQLYYLRYFGRIAAPCREAAVIRD